MLLEWWSGTECTIYTDPHAYPKYGKENAIVILNHKFEIDFLCGWSLSERLGILGVSDRCIRVPRSFLRVRALSCLFFFLALDHSEFAEESAEFCVVVLQNEMFFKTALHSCLGSGLTS